MTRWSSLDKVAFAGEREREREREREQIIV